MTTMTEILTLSIKSEISIVNFNKAFSVIRLITSANASFS